VNISKEILDEVALSEKEYKLIVQQLGREPNMAGAIDFAGESWRKALGGGGL